MFTGLIEAVGLVSDLTPAASGFRLAITAPFAAQLSEGESVAVSGVCLTVASAGRREFQADIGPETARVTTLGGLRPGHTVNLERSMRADGRFGGHFVQGHVDGVGVVRAISVDGEAHWISVGFPESLESLVVLKGAVAVDGVSLTVARLDASSLDVMIVPYTWTHTSLSALEVGESVNLECDIVGKYVARSLDLTRSRVQS
jgi:riboflavin synthase